MLVKSCLTLCDAGPAGVVFIETPQTERHRHDTGDARSVMTLHKKIHIVYLLFNLLTGLYITNVLYLRQYMRSVI